LQLPALIIVFTEAFYFCQTGAVLSGVPELSGGAVKIFETPVVDT